MEFGRAGLKQLMVTRETRRAMGRGRSGRVALTDSRGATISVADSSAAGGGLNFFFCKNLKTVNIFDLGLLLKQIY